MDRSLVTATAVAIIAAVQLAGCAAAPVGSPPGREMAVDSGVYRDIAPYELNEMLNRKDFQLVNVHVPYDGEIAGTDVFIPFDQVEQNLDKLPPDRSSRIVVYCRSGPMSTTASETLVRLGFTNVFNLAGGMTEWKRQGHSLVDKRKG